MSEVITAEHGSDGGHWYDREGNPAYTVVGKNGKIRNTTLRDARQLGLVPSVTSIIALAAKPGLINWIIDQHIMAALTLPRNQDENDTDFIVRIKEDAKAQSDKAKETGTRIHAWVQQSMEGKKTPAESVDYVASANVTLHNECGLQDWICEQSFATRRFGGKVDLHCPSFIIDIKTTDKDKDVTWPEHHQQLAAYSTGLCLPTEHQCGILYINTKTAESRMVWISEEDLNWGGWQFEALTDYWYAKNKMEVDYE